MTHDEMIKKLGTTDEVFKSYVDKSSAFIGGLSEEELKLHAQFSPPSLPAALLKKDGAPEEINSLFDAAPRLVGTTLASIENRKGGILDGGGGFGAAPTE